MIGKTLIHYEITAEIGKGGMGEVYQAKDTKLGRDVAIKVLPEEFALDTDRVARFQREAKLLASLNHPNIAAIYGLEEAEGMHFLVMELIEGDTLRDRIKTGPIPIEEALNLALQIAEGLEAAHEKGVIHRDLKPANIKVTPNGKVKILDFGLAKAYAGDQGNVSLADSPTISVAATQQGVILGTAAYMSPEQAKGRPVDKRADIWAFGVVLFEILTGKSLFSGEDVTSTVARVLEREPDFSTLPQNLHPRIQFMIERCLKKDPKDRYSAISDARVDIQEVLADPRGVLVQPVTTVESRNRLWTVFFWLMTVVVFSIITGAVIWNMRKPELRQVTRFQYELPKDRRFGDLIERSFAVSPDGRKLVCSTDMGLYLRSMEETDARLLPGTMGARRPCFSPDGKWIVYSSAADNRLRKIGVGGGAPIDLTDASIVGSIVWTEKDKIVYGQFGKGIMQVSADGGTPEMLIKEEEVAIGYPQILPDEESVMFTSNVPPKTKIVVQSLKSGERKELVVGGNAQYLSTGHIVYGVENSLFAVPFDLENLEVTGGSVPLVNGVYRGGPSQFAVSGSGTLFFIPRGETAGSKQHTLVWVDRMGEEETIEAPSNAYSNPKISPDGTRVALTIESGGNQDIWIWNLIHKNTMRLTLDEALDRIPLWSLDGKRIVFASSREGNYGVHWKAADGTGEVEGVGWLPARLIIPNSWSHDGKTLLLTEWANIPPRFDISMLSMEEDRVNTILLQGGYSEAQPRISPNGLWMGYVSDESGRNEIYVRPFPDVDKERWPISTSGGDSPLWSPDGRELFYRSGTAIMAVAVETEPTFKFEAPEELFQGTYVSFTAPVYGQIENNPWDISPDGKRFLMMKPTAATDDESATGISRKINIVLNWFEELKARVPVD